MIFQAIFKRLFHFREMIFLLWLMALACLPIALSDLVRDAGLSLLLPLTLSGAILAWALAGLGVRKSLSGFALLLLGPLVLCVRIGQMGGSLFEFIKQSLNFIAALFNWLFNNPPSDLSIFLSSRDEFLQKASTLVGRISLWFTGFFRGVQIEDPVVRTLIWSLILWLIVVWAGWQIYRHNRFMAGMLPSTILLIFVLDYTGGENIILWLYLVLLLFLYGLTNYHNLQARWDFSHIDYSDSTSFDTLMLVGIITFVLVLASTFAFKFSIKDILDNFRQRRQGSNEAQAQSLGLESVKDNFRVTGLENGLPRSYLLSAGPEISTQLAMTISTGDLPPMPQNAHLLVPRYYWRTLTYSIYTGSGWSNPPVSTQDVPANKAIVGSTGTSYRVVKSNVTFPDNLSDRLYWTGTLVSANVPIKAVWSHKAKNTSLLDNDMLAALAPAKTYTAESVLLNVTADDLRASPSVYPDWVREQFLALPDSVPERVLSLARDLTASGPNAYDRAIAIQNYLRQFPYTLDIGAPPAGRDVADYFIFDLKQGYCDYYATSMAVLARAAGLPARLVVGYANGSYDQEHAQYIVTENYAHSWVEIYFANIGWVEFEPTSSQPVILYEGKNDSTNPATEGTSSVSVSSQGRFISFIQHTFENSSIPIILLFVCGFLWIGFDLVRLNRIAPSDTIQLLYKRFRRLARPLTGYASRNQTALSYSQFLIERLSAIKTSARLQNWIKPSYGEIDQLTELFSHSLFAPLSPTREEAKSAIKTWSRLRWRLMLANVLGIKK